MPRLQLPFLVLAFLLPLPIECGRPCDPSCIKLSSYEVWRREAGWWVGNYTLLGADGAPFTSPNWPYGYAAYHGFIRIELDGPCLSQRNVFVYPPLPPSECAASGPVVGPGTCGVNGNEKVFEADQSASDCAGNLAGPFAFGGTTLDTETTVTIGSSDTVIYQVRLPASPGAAPRTGQLLQNQITTVGPDGTRLRSAQDIGPGTGRGRGLSFFREERVSEEAWQARLAEVRRKFSVLPADYCGWDILNLKTSKTCEEHFATPPCPKRTSSKRCRRVRRTYRRCVKRGQCNCA